MTPSNTLLIDAGNSFLKLSRLIDEEISEIRAFSYPHDQQLDFISALIEKEANGCDEIIAVSVRHDEFAQLLKEVAQKQRLKFSLVTAQKELAGITNAYVEPASLGADRMVAMVGALALLQANKEKSPYIVIDSGTAATIDAIDSQGNHLGGVILPGYELNEQSLLSNTDLLPVLNIPNESFSPTVFSTNTSQAISSGCLLGNSAAVDGICNSIETQIKNNFELDEMPIPRFICGGGAGKILPLLTENYQHEEKLIMMGLKRIKETGWASE